MDGSHEALRDKKDTIVSFTLVNPDIETVLYGKTKGPREIRIDYNEDEEIEFITFIPRTSRFIDQVQFHCIGFKNIDDNIMIDCKDYFSLGSRSEEVLAEYIKFVDRAVGRLTKEGEITKVKYIGYYSGIHDITKPKPSPKKGKVKSKKE